RHLTGSAGKATLAVALFLLGGGWGWWLPVRSALASHAGWLDVFAHPWDRTVQDAAGFRWQNVYASLLAPQRAYLYGLPLGLLALRLLDSAIERGRVALFLIAGIVAGLLPLAHQGTLLSLALITPFLALLFPALGWAWFFGAWAVVGLPQVLPLLRDGPGPLSAFRFHLGWIAAPDPWPWFWLKNLGLFLPLAIVGFAWRRVVSGHARRFLLALMPAFVLANLFLFQPWDWDNTKILTLWFFAIAMLAAAVLVELWQTWRTPLVRLAVAVAIATL